MFAPFFTLAMVSPSRQRALRVTVLAHLCVLAALCAGSYLNVPGFGALLLGNALLIAGVVEGALVIGWRLTQIPKSQSLEFLLVSPLRPWGVLLGEATVGLTRLALVTLAGLPLLMLLVIDGKLLLDDLPAVVLLPYVWGAVTG